MAGSVSFKLRTTETEGLIMYNPGAGGTVSEHVSSAGLRWHSENREYLPYILGSHLLIIVPLVF